MLSLSEKAAVPSICGSGFRSASYIERDIQRVELMEVTGPREQSLKPTVRPRRELRAKRKASKVSRPSASPTAR
jgi:hypothetical protein